MYAILVTRLVKVNTGKTERFAPRTNTVEKWGMVGPFESMSLAQRTAGKLAEGVTTLAAEVMDFDQLREYAREHRGPHGAELVVTRFLATHHGATV